MHNQAWVRGDYSDVVVRLSAIYAALRDDHVAEENNDAAQAFSRSTTKYWVRTEDVSKVKHAVDIEAPASCLFSCRRPAPGRATVSLRAASISLGEFQNKLLAISY